MAVEWTANGPWRTKESAFTYVLFREDNALSYQK